MISVSCAARRVVWWAGCRGQILLIKEGRLRVKGRASTGIGKDAGCCFNLTFTVVSKLSQDAGNPEPSWHIAIKTFLRGSRVCCGCKGSLHSHLQTLSNTAAGAASKKLADNLEAGRVAFPTSTHSALPRQEQQVMWLALAALTYCPKTFKAAWRAKKAALRAPSCRNPSFFGVSGGTGHQCTAPNRMSSRTKSCRAQAA